MKHSLEMMKIEDENSLHKIQNENETMMVEDENNKAEDIEDETNRSTPKWYSINVEFLPAKFGYFFEEAKKIGYLPNQILFLTSVGMTKSESGIILGLR